MRRTLVCTCVSNEDKTEKAGKTHYGGDGDLPAVAAPVLVASLSFSFKRCVSFPMVVTIFTPEHFTL